MIFRNQIFIAFTFLFVQSAFAQEGASIRASVDKNRILIGEPLYLTLEINQSPGTTRHFTGIDSIAHFEFLAKPVMDSTARDAGLSIKAVYKITSFDSGHWVIPAISFAEGITSDTIPVDVVFSDFDPAQDYHTIKDILEPKLKKKVFPWWWYAAGAGLLLAVAFIYLRRKKPVLTAAPKGMLNAFKEAMEQLEQLQKENPEAKQFHSRLIDIFRLYIFRKSGLLSLQKTTDDLVIQLKPLYVNKEQFDRLSQSLRMSDFVKFAKFVPSAQDNRQSWEEIKAAITTLEKKEDAFIASERS